MSETEVTAAPCFEDAAGNRWQLKFTLGMIDRIASEHGIDLAPENGDLSPAAMLCGQPRKLAQILWTALKSQAEEREITSSDFLYALDPETLKDAWEAFIEAVIFFTQPTPSARQAAKEQIETVLDLYDQAAQAQLEEMGSKEVREAVDRGMGRLKKEFRTTISNRIDEAPMSMPAS